MFVCLFIPSTPEPRGFFRLNFFVQEETPAAAAETAPAVDGIGPLGCRRRRPTAAIPLGSRRRRPTAAIGCLLRG